MSIELLESRIAPATFLVTNLSDSGEGSLRAAIALANDQPGADLITFQKGLTGQIDLAAGEMLITDTLTIRGPGANKLALDGQGLSRIFQARNPEGDFPLAVSGLAFFNGFAGNFDPAGAIYSLESLTVTKCLFVSNESTLGGGAIYAVQGLDTTISVSIRQSSFFHNFTSSREGGAVYILAEGDAAVKQCTFDGNISEGRGGALYIDQSTGSVTVEKSRFVGNRAPEIGALGISNGNGTALVRGNLFTGNQATEDAGVAGAVAMFGGEIVFHRNVLTQNAAFLQGGGMFAAQFTSLTINQCQFVDNASQLSGFLNGGGGGVAIGSDQPDGSTARIIGSVFSGNTSTRGGGIYVHGDPFLLEITTTKITGNRSGNHGGGIYIEKNVVTNDSAEVSVSKSTIAGNTSGGLGGGIYGEGEGSLSLKASKVTGNVAQDDGGGLYLAFTTEVLISGSAIAKNLAGGDGGGIATLSALAMSSSKVMGNSAGDQGGGIRSSAALELVASTISGNLSVLGGGVYQTSADPLTITNSKVRGNISVDGLQVVDE